MGSCIANFQDSSNMTTIDLLLLFAKDEKRSSPLLKNNDVLLLLLFSRINLLFLVVDCWD